jgi:hypothetical protein
VSRKIGAGSVISATTLTVNIVDSGSAHDVVIVKIRSIFRLTYEEQFTGRTSKCIPVTSGTYPCTVALVSTRTGALGLVSNSEVSINGIQVASASGSIQNGDDGDAGIVSFQITIP